MMEYIENAFVKPAVENVELDDLDKVDLKT